MMSFLSKSYQIVLDRAFDTPGHGKYVVGGFNDIQQRYLATCLRMCSTPEVDNFDSKCMPVDSKNETAEVSFAKECKCLLHLLDDISTKCDKKHSKRELKAHLNHK